MATAPSLAPAAAEPALVTAEALVHLFNAMREELVGTLVYVLGNREDAHDVAQETFIKCWRHRGDLQDVKNLRAWIFRVALNTATDLQRSAWHRHAKPLSEGMEERAMPEASAAGQLEHAEELERLRAAIHSLRPDEKEIFLLRQNGDLTFQEIAELRRVPIGTVKTQMRAALQKLRKVLT